VWGHSGADGCGSCSCRSWGGPQEGTHSATTVPRESNQTYKVALGGDPVGAKTLQGDHKTPEGRYALDSRNVHSRFYKSIYISHPSASDRAVARQKGIAPGGEVFLNGLPKWLRQDRRVAPTRELDGRMRRSQQSRDRRDLDGCGRREPRSRSVLEFGIPERSLPLRYENHGFGVAAGFANLVSILQR